MLVELWGAAEAVQYFRHVEHAGVSFKDMAVQLELMTGGKKNPAEKSLVMFWKGNICMQSTIFRWMVRGFQKYEENMLAFKINTTILTTS